MEGESSGVTNILMVVAVIAVVISAFGLFASLDVFKGAGYATSDVGNVTFEIASNVDIAFTTNIINWTSGYINNVAPCGDWAILNSNGTNICAVNWRTVTQGLTLESRSSVDINVTLTSNRGINDLIGLTSVPGFMWKVDENESRTCNNVAGGWYGPTTYTEIVAGTPVKICESMNYGTSNNALDIDFQVNITKNAIVTDYRTAVITASAQRGTQNTTYV